MRGELPVESEDEVPTGARFVFSWTLTMVVAEVLGFGSVFALGNWMAGSFEESTSLWLGMAAASGLIEGSCLGLGQWLWLRRIFPRLGAMSWLGGTVLGGVVAWIGGMSFGMFGFEAVPAGWYVGPLAVASGFGLGAVLGAGQWLVLRGHVDGAERWIVANGVGWMIGLFATYLSSALVRDPVPVWLVILAGGLGGAAMAVAPGIATGVSLIRLRSRGAAA